MNAPKKAPAKRAASRKPAVRKPKPLAAEVTVQIPPATLAAALRNALICASNDDLCPILTAALFEFPPNMIRIVTTDSYKLLVQEMPRDDKTAAASVLVPRSVLMLWQKLLLTTPKPRKKDPLPPPATIAFTADSIEFTAGVVHAKTTPGSGAYPDWQKLVGGAKAPTTSGCAVNPTFLKALSGLVSLNGVTNSVLTLTPQDALKPLRVSLKQGEGYKVDALLMPVRAS